MSRTKLKYSFLTSLYDWSLTVSLNLNSEVLRIFVFFELLLFLICCVPKFFFWSCVLLSLYNLCTWIALF